MKYSYNGIVLPALPNSELPYACISRHTNDTDGTVFCRLCLYDKEGVVSRWAYDELNVPEGTSYEGYYLEDIDSETWIRSDRWSGGPTKDEGTLILPINGSSWAFVWSNIDLYKEDGSLAYSGGPAPVPVTDHNALMQGWIVGKRLAAQRGRA